MLVCLHVLYIQSDKSLKLKHNLALMLSYNSLITILSSFTIDLNRLVKRTVDVRFMALNHRDR